MLALNTYPQWTATNNSEREDVISRVRDYPRGGRGLAWSKIRAWGVRGRGFKSHRPHFSIHPPHSGGGSLSLSEQFGITELTHIPESVLDEIPL